MKFIIVETNLKGIGKRANFFNQNFVVDRVKCLGEIKISDIDTSISIQYAVYEVGGNDEIGRLVTVLLPDTKPC